MAHDDFSWVCEKLGKDPSLVQGPGGNLSVKRSDREMLIKASGFTLSEVRADHGTVRVDYPFLQRFLLPRSTANAAEENALNDAYREATLDANGLRPSMETGFHVFLGQSVLHTHPVYPNILTCMENGERVLRDIFPDMPFHWIPYHNPGLALALAVKDMNVQPSDETQVFFLQNHGIILSSSSLSSCYEKLLDVNNKIIAYLTRTVDGFPLFSVHSLRPYKKGFINDGPLVKHYLQKIKEDPSLLQTHLFPDSVTFCHGLRSGQMNPGKNTVSLTDEGIIYTYDQAKATWINEVMTAYLYLLTTIPLLGKRRALPDKDVAYILGMDAEKYRQERMSQSF